MFTEGRLARVTIQSTAYRRLTRAWAFQRTPSRPVCRSRDCTTASHARRGAQEGPRAKRAVDRHETAETRSGGHVVILPTPRCRARRPRARARDSTPRQNTTNSLSNLLVRIRQRHGRRAVDAPRLGARDLQDEDVAVVRMRGDGLRARRRRVEVGERVRQRRRRLRKRLADSKFNKNRQCDGQPWMRGRSRRDDVVGAEEGRNVNAIGLQAKGRVRRLPLTTTTTTIVTVLALVRSRLRARSVEGAAASPLATTTRLAQLVHARQARVGVVDDERRAVEVAVRGRRARRAARRECAEVLFPPPVRRDETRNSTREADAIPPRTATTRTTREA